MSRVFVIKDTDGYLLTRVGVASLAEFFVLEPSMWEDVAEVYDSSGMLMQVSRVSEIAIRLSAQAFVPRALICDIEGHWRSHGKSRSKQGQELETIYQSLMEAPVSSCPSSEMAEHGSVWHLREALGDDQDREMLWRELELFASRLLNEHRANREAKVSEREIFLCADVSTDANLSGDKGALQSLDWKFESGEEFSWLDVLKHPHMQIQKLIQATSIPSHGLYGFDTSGPETRRTKRLVWVPYLEMYSTQVVPMIRDHRARRIVRKWSGVSESKEVVSQVRRSAELLREGEFCEFSIFEEFHLTPPHGLDQIDELVTELLKVSDSNLAVQVRLTIHDGEIPSCLVFKVSRLGSSPIGVVDDSLAWSTSENPSQFPSAGEFATAVRKLDTGNGDGETILWAR